MFALGQSGWSQDWIIILEKQFNHSGLEREKTGCCCKNKDQKQWCPEIKCLQWKWKNEDEDGFKADSGYFIRQSAGTWDRLDVGVKERMGGGTCKMVEE